MQDLERVVASGFTSTVTTRRYLSVQSSAREETGGIIDTNFCLIDVDGGLTTGMLDGVGAWLLGLWDGGGRGEQRGDCDEGWEGAQWLGSAR